MASDSKRDDWFFALLGFAFIYWALAGLIALWLWLRAKLNAPIRVTATPEELAEVRASVDRWREREQRRLNEVRLRLEREDARRRAEEAERAAKEQREEVDRKQREKAEQQAKQRAEREAIASRPNMPPASEAAPEAADEAASGPAPRALTHAEWHASTDACRLLLHAVTRIPTQHLCLVLAEFAEELWPHFHEKCPNDWRPAWCIATLRAWCFGEATLEEVRAAREAAARLGYVRVGDGYSCEGTMAVRAAVLSASYAHDEGIELDDADAAIDVLLSAMTARHHPLTRAVLLAWRVAEEGASPVGRGYGLLEDREVYKAATAAHDRDALSEFAERLRARIAWPARASERWVVREGVVKSGDATLVVEGWKVVEVRAYEPERRGRSSLPA